MSWDIVLGCSILVHFVGVFLELAPKVHRVFFKRVTGIMVYGMILFLARHDATLANYLQCTN